MTHAAMIPADPRIDVAICTRDRQASLTKTLESLVGAAKNWERIGFLIVDSSEGGIGPALTRWVEADRRIRVVSEPRPGVYFARATAIAASTADLLVFIDDDVLVAPDFFDALAPLFADPSVGGVGGAILSADDRLVPAWMSARLRQELPELPVHVPIEDCRYPVFPPTACLALRRHPCLDHYLSAERGEIVLGAGGRAGFGGEDTDLCEIMARAGFRVIRSAAVRVYHHVHADRLDPQWIIGKFAKDGRMRVAMARLRGTPAVSRETAKALLALPVLAALRPFARCFDTRRSVLIRAYFAKSRSAWWELLWGRRDIRFSYPPQSAPKR